MSIELRTIEDWLACATTRGEIHGFVDVAVLQAETVGRLDRARETLHAGERIGRSKRGFEMA